MKKIVGRDIRRIFSPTLQFSSNKKFLSICVQHQEGAGGKYGQESFNTPKKTRSRRSKNVTAAA